MQFNTYKDGAGNKLKSGMIQRLPPSIKYLNISDNEVAKLTQKNDTCEYRL